ncbi:MAG: cysteinyl-tRNA synthetase [Actinomycetota bacterium]|jgi:cysteinyl-tRNA synthetase|nr:cysteinyl-tRNA synthetase [Actinomycetota bacterium]
MIQVSDTLRREVVPLETRDPGRAGIYTCGLTVYNYAHVGNMRSIIWFDFIRAYLAYRGYNVTFVMNYTDVDDKIIERAKVEGIPPEAVTAKYTKAFEDDLLALGGRMPDVTPRATGHIEDMIGAIQGLVDKGFAYESEGNVWFAVEKFDSYGKLSHRSLDDMRAGERIEPHPSKHNPLDFSLWKAAKEGEPAWDSPWGPGRPGWHIECSVMSEKYLGMGFDIHGGGSDLIFPHHENEIAQAEALFGAEPLARYWLHSGMVQMDAEKMSKSLGNVALARDVLERYPGEAVRYWMLQSTYRSQVVFSEKSLNDASQSYERWRNFKEAAAHALGDEMPASPEPLLRPLDDDSLPTGYVQTFINALDDDFSSAEAFAAIHELVGEANKRVDGAQRGDAETRAELIELTRTFLELTGVLGMKFPSVDSGSEIVGALVEAMLELRERARARKDFEEADAIRDKFVELGIVIEDTPAGARWRIGVS